MIATSAQIMTNIHGISALVAEKTNNCDYGTVIRPQ
jgi:hypothetical protein